MSRSPITLLGISHRTAPLAERERFALTRPAGQRLLVEQGSESLLLVTCNRTELYTTTDAVAAEHRLREAAGGPDAHLFRLEEHAAVRHLFEVAAGLDSMVVGEPQILGQVKRAMADAREAAVLGADLDALVRRALSVGRRVRGETAVGSGLPSIPKVATGMARLVLGELTNRTLLVVGTGKVGDLTARALREAGAGRILVTNRSPAAASRLADAVGGEALAWEALDQALGEVDIVLACTAAEAPILGVDRLTRALERRGGRSLLVIDIAVPRDVAPAVREVPGIRLFDLDDLRGWSSEAVPPQAIAAARAIVDAETAAYEAWRAARAAVPTIRALQARAERILEAEIAREDGADAEALRRFGKRLVGKLLHHPMRRLRDGAAADGEDWLAMARELFDLEGDNGADGPHG